jgi:putative lumazine-binding protein
MKEEEAAITATARDYYEGWYDADVARMRRALHLELAKRFVEDADGAELGPRRLSVCSSSPRRALGISSTRANS